MANEVQPNTDGVVAASKQPMLGGRKKIIAIIVAVVLLGVLAGGGYYVWRDYQKKHSPAYTEKDAQAKSLLTKLAKTNKASEKAYFEFELGERYKALGQWDKAKQYYTEAKTYYEKQKDTKNLQSTNNAIAFCDHQLEVQKAETKLQPYYDRNKDTSKYKDVKPGATD